MFQQSATVKLQSPSSLQYCSLAAVLEQLTTLCSDSNYEENKRGLKHFLKFELPPHVRQQLLYLAFDDGRIYTSTDLNIYELLLSPTVQDLRVKNIRPFYRDSFSRILQQLGTGLQRLVIEDSSWTQPRNALSNALSHLSFLREVSLRYLATDIMLNTLGRSCNYLQELDITGSQDVTNDGLQRLCVPVKDEEMCTCQQEPAKKPSRKISVPANFGISALRNDKLGSGRHAPSCVVWIPRLIKGIRRHSVINNSKVEVNEVHNCQHSSDSFNVNDFVVIAPCVRTLRKVFVTGTKVTNEGIAILKEYTCNIVIVSN